MSNDGINLNRKWKVRKKFWIKKKMGIDMAMVYLWHKEKTALARVEGVFEE